VLDENRDDCFRLRVQDLLEFVDMNFLERIGKILSMPYRDVGMQTQTE
jgi:hypothetical protein